jgi:hypothetical protein
MQIIHVSEFDLPRIFIDTVYHSAHHSREVFRILVTLIRESDRLPLLLVILLVIPSSLYNCYSLCFRRAFCTL